MDHVSKVIGGAEINLLELLATPMVAERWETVVACAPGGALEHSLQRAGIRCLPFGFDASLNELRIVDRSSGLWAQWQGWQEVRRGGMRLAAHLQTVRPAVVVSCTNKDHFAAGMACDSARIPSIWWINDILTSEFFSWPVRRVFFHQARSNATHLLPVSECGKRALIDGGLDPARITTLHNGIPLERYTRHPTRTFREHLRFPANEPLIGIAGRITPWKGQEIFIRVAETWRKQGRPGRFVIIGRAFNEELAYEEKLRVLVKELGLDDYVKFVSFQENIAQSLSSLDVLLHCSIKSEPFGRVIIEAMAVGVPVIAANSGGVAEIIDGNQNGSLVPPGHIAGYVAELASLLASPERQMSYARKAREKVVGQFNVERVASEMERSFQHVAGN